VLRAENQKKDDNRDLTTDHVVVHATGVYVIETKTHSKPDKGSKKVRWDGEVITVGGFTPDRNPVEQVRAARRWLAERLIQSTGRKFPFREVILYPGWFVENVSRRNQNDPWVLNPKALRSFMANAPHTVAPEDVTLCAFHLDRFIRAVKMEAGR